MADDKLANRIFSELPPHEWDVLKPDIHRLNLTRGEVLYEQEETLHHVYFPAGAALSTVKLMHNGNTVEVGTVGVEGMAGIQATLGADLVPEQCITQIAGPAYCMRIRQFSVHFERLPVFRRSIQRYAQWLYSMMAQSIACNRLHHINQRCARWLLMTSDRVASAKFELTHEYLAVMLGANRPSVSIAAANLQDAGLISYSRGLIQIDDFQGLKNASCECYGVTASHYDHLFPKGKGFATASSAA